MKVQPVRIQGAATGYADAAGTVADPGATGSSLSVVYKELRRKGCALSVAMETNPDYEPTVAVYESADGVLDVIIRTVDDDELKKLRESRRRPPKPVH